MNFQHAQAAMSAASGGKGDKEKISGSFDPTALERGAKALKELDASQNATKAFELTKLQETTKQKEMNLQMEQMRAQQAEMGLQRAQKEGEERRKTIAAQEDQERRTAQYKTQLESELYQHKLEDQQKQNEAWLQQQHQNFLRQEEIRKGNDRELEEMRRRTMSEQAKLDRETMLLKAQAESEARAKTERENVDVRIREMRAQAGEERSTRLQSIEAYFGGFSGLLSDKQKITTLVTGLSALALGVYAARNVTRVAGNLAEKNLGKPSLVRDTSRWSWKKSFLPMGYSGGAATQTNGKMLDKIVLQDELSERLTWMTNSLVNAKKNGTPFRHMLLHGPPGTGKTLFARTLAKRSGLDYAIMSGGDVGPLGKDAVEEVNKLFTWANKSKKGMVLFIDEADAFLRKGRQSSDGMSEHARNVLSTFLAHTGTETDKFAVVLATNVKDVLDRAVMDRVDERFLFPLPEYDQRLEMVKMFMDQHILSPTKTSQTIEVEDAVKSEEYMQEMAKRMDGFSGRQVAKTILGLQAAVFGSGTNKLTKGLADAVLDWKIANIGEDQDSIDREEAEQLRLESKKLGTY
ncbi:unnamed protein product [Amoebophrya sp. A25]|nr:unnamed protein product [Amoebophrya sp. A25]|eukprot:GSA25T00012719001.1